MSLVEVSVIIPVYNVDKYIRRCVESLLCQTFTNFELILVDDGSTDGSSDICDAYANVDSPVRVIHKSNGGLSSARNAGLDIATGERIIFVDADDAVNPNYLEDLVGGNADVAISQCCLVAEEKSVPMLFTSDSFVGKDGVELFLNDYFDCTLVSSAWAKILQHSTIQRLGLRFDERLRAGEDQIFMLRYYLEGNVKSIEIRNSACYYYSTDISTSLSKKKVDIDTSLLALRQIHCMLDNRKYLSLKKKLCKSHLNNIKNTISNDIRYMRFGTFMSTVLRLDLIANVVKCFTVLVKS